MNQDIENEMFQKPERLLDALQKRDQNILISRGFRVLKSVRLANIAVNRITGELNSPKRNVEDTEEVYVNKKQIRKKFLSTNFRNVCTFSNKREALEFIKQNTCWKEKDYNYFLVNGGRKVRYRCTLTNSAGPSCQAEICLFYRNDSDEVTLQRNEKEHTNHHYLLHADSFFKPSESLNETVFIKMEIDDDSEEFETDNLATELITDNYTNLNTITKEELIITDEYVDGNVTSVETDGQTSGETHPSEPCLAINNNILPKVRGYVFKEIFPSALEAFNAMKRTSDHWALTVKKEVGDITRIYFRCNFSTYASQCPSRVVLIERLKLCDTLYYEKGSHNHVCEERNAIGANEIVISDESSLDSVKSNDDFGEWAFERKFDDYKSASDYLQEMNLVSFEPKITKEGIQEYYKCKIMVGTNQYCAPSRYLQYTELNNILMYKRHVRHVDICENATTPPLVPISNETPNVPNRTVNNDNLDKMSSSHRPDSLGVVKQWILEKTFNSLKTARHYVESDQIWSYKDQSASKEATVIFYCCNVENNSAQQCPSAKFIYIKAKTKIISLYKTVEGHTCSMKSKITPDIVFASLNVNTKTKLQKLVSAGHPPDYILEKLEIDLRFELDGFHLYFQQPLYDWIRKMQRELLLNNSDMPTVTEIIEDWLLKNNAIPKADREHQAYCVSYFIDLKKDFRFFWSTRSLLRSAVAANSVHIDSTCVLNWRRKPITIIGTTDIDQTFHLFGIAVSSQRRQIDYEFMFEALQKGVQQCHNQIFKPEYLNSDYNGCVHGAFHKVFGSECKIGTSPKEVLNKIALNLSLSKCDISVKDEVRLDILKILQLSSRTLLLKALELFYQKWESNEHLTDFLNCVESIWVNRISNWFQVFPHFKPDTRKAIRHEYASFKRKDAYHHNFPIESFQCYIEDYIESVSTSYTRNGPRITRKATVPIWERKKAIEWQKLKKQFKCVDDVTEIRYYIPAGDEKFICEEKFHKYLMCNHQSLEEFFEIHYSFWCVSRSKISDVLSCSCPYFWDNLVCRHSIGMGLELKLDMNKNIEWIH